MRTYMMSDRRVVVSCGDRHLVVQELGDHETYLVTTTRTRSHAKRQGVVVLLPSDLDFRSHQWDDYQRDLAAIGITVDSQVLGARIVNRTRFAVYGRDYSLLTPTPALSIARDKSIAAREDDVMEYLLLATRTTGLSSVFDNDRGVRVTSSAPAVNQAISEGIEAAGEYLDPSVWRAIDWSAGLPVHSWTDHPLTAVDVMRLARKLQLLLSYLDREVVVAALVGDRKPDLLDSERQEVDRVRQFLDDRIAAVPIASDLRRRCSAVLDSLVNEFEPTAQVHDSSPSVDGGSSPTVGDAPADGVEQSASSANGDPLRDLLFLVNAPRHVVEKWWGGRLGRTGRIWPSDLSWLTDRGVPVRHALARDLEVSTDAVDAQANAGMVDAQMLADAIGRIAATYRNGGH